MKILNSLAALLFVLFPWSAKADPVDLVIHFSDTSPYYVSVTMVEQAPGRLKVLVDALTEKKAERFDSSNPDATSTIQCMTSAVSTTCRFKFMQHIPNVVFDPFKAFSVSEKLADLPGTERLAQNPALTVPFEFTSSSGDSFYLQVTSEGFTASGLLLK